MEKDLQYPSNSLYYSAPSKMIETHVKKETNHYYIPGKNSVEKQHLSEHETLQILQRHALNGKREEFFELLETIDGTDKKKDIMEMCGMNGDIK